MHQTKNKINSWMSEKEMRNRIALAVLGVFFLARSSSQFWMTQWFILKTDQRGIDS